MSRLQLITTYTCIWNFQSVRMGMKMSAYESWKYFYVFNYSDLFECRRFGLCRNHFSRWRFCGSRCCCWSCRGRDGALEEAISDEDGDGDCDYSLCILRLWSHIGSWAIRRECHNHHFKISHVVITFPSLVSTYWINAQLYIVWYFSIIFSS